MQNVNTTKEKILSIIQQTGPSFPVKIARAINVTPLFTAVFLSELYEDGKLKMSNMKIGNSQLYYLQNQKAQLENFIEHLNQREKEAFHLIKNRQILEDERQVPVVRVALRAIKDFAHPFKLNINDTEKTFWKYHLLSNEEFDNRTRKILNPDEKIKQKQKEKPKEIKARLKEGDTLKGGATYQGNVVPIYKEQAKEIKTKEKTKKKAHSDFAEKIKDYLLSKDIEILSSILEKKKEFAAKIRIDTIFGKQEFYLIAKEKKKINETDLALALQKAQSEKMPALIISPGDIDKKASTYLKEWRNLIKFEKISFI